MDQNTFSKFQRTLEERFRQWGSLECVKKDPSWQLIGYLPELMKPLVEIFGKSDLSERERLWVARVMKYLISPLDHYPEYILGPSGYIEDLYLLLILYQKLGHSDTPLISKKLITKTEHVVKEQLSHEQVARLLSLLSDEIFPGDDFLFQKIPQSTSTARGEKTIYISGPGTGKTYQIENDVFSLLIDKKIPPQNILVTTFTNKAADELMVRLRNRLHKEKTVKNPDFVSQQLTVCTIHHFCYQLVSQFHHQVLFLRGIFYPLDDAQRLLFLFREGIKLGLLKNIYELWKQEQDYDMDLFHFYQYVGDIYDFISEDVVGKENPALLNKYIELVSMDISERTKLDVIEQIICTYPKYWNALQSEGYMDNSMILAYVSALLEDPHVLSKVRSQYRYIFVDEYQDTNPIQDQIFRKIADATIHLTVVGDEDQAIYGFRGADIQNFISFKDRYPDAQEKFLEDNRRSTPEIIKAVSTLIRNNKKVRYANKELKTSNPSGSKPWQVIAKDTANLPLITAELIKWLKESGTVSHWRDIAVLFRTRGKFYSKYIQTLKDLNIPIERGADKTFLKQPVVNAFIGILEMISGDAGKITPRKRKHKPFFQAIGVSDSGSMLEMTRIWHSLFRQKDIYVSIVDLFYAILKDSGAREKGTILEEMGRLSKIISEAEEQMTSYSLHKRLSWLLTYLDAAKGQIEGTTNRYGDKQGVQIMTMHAAKGLQFPIVIIPEAIDGRLPFFFGENRRDTLRQKMAGIKSALDPMEEERRVLYVAMTRAEHLLIFITVSGLESPFLKEFETQKVLMDKKKPSINNIRPRHLELPPPLHLSHSEIFSYGYCPKRFSLEHLYGFTGRPIKPIRAGRTLHKAIEIFHRLLRDGSQINQNRIEEIFNRCWIKSPSDTEQEKLKIQRIFEDYVKTVQKEPQFHVIDQEQKIAIVENKGVLTGKADLVRERNGKLELVEFKFSENKQLEMKDYPSHQLNCYQLAFSEQKPRLFVHYLRDRQEHEIPPQSESKIRAHLSEVLDQIRNKNFEPRPSEARCRLCLVKDACPDAAPGAVRAIKKKAA